MNQVKREKDVQDDGRKFTKFLEWFRKGGGEDNKLKLHWYRQNERGVLAEEDIKKGELLLKIPYSLLITWDMI